jgi:uncharacterized RDD family membrane protein YckC
MKYAGFTKRFLALLLDGILIIPLMVLMILFSTKSLLLFSFIQIISFCTTIFLNIYLVKQYGGSPGKLIVNIKIVKKDGTEIGWKEAVLRNIIDLCFTISLNVILISLIISQKIPFGTISYTDYVQIVQKEGMYKFLNTIQSIWVWGELLVLLTNKKRRSIHDFIAGTVVIYKENNNKELEN